MQTDVLIVGAARIDDARSLEEYLDRWYVARDTRRPGPALGVGDDARSITRSERPARARREVLP